MKNNNDKKKWGLVGGGFAIYSSTVIDDRKVEGD